MSSNNNRIELLRPAEVRTVAMSQPGSDDVDDGDDDDSDDDDDEGIKNLIK